MKELKKCLAFAVVLILVMGFAGTGMAGDTTTVDVTANVVGTCRFISPGTMAFGLLDPASGGDVNANVNQPSFWCTKGASYTISDDNGFNPSGTLYRMKLSDADEFIIYEFTYTEKTGTGNGPTNPIEMNIAGKILEDNYKNASAGEYSDTVTLTITP